MANFGAFSWMGKDNQGSSSKKANGQKGSSNKEDSDQEEYRQRNRSPVRHPRKLLEGAFDNLIISSSKSSDLKLSMPQALTRSFRANGWPNWKTTIRGSKPAEPAIFTIRMNSGYRTYAAGDATNLPEQIYSQFQTDLQAVRNAMQEHKDLEPIIHRDLIENLCELVFSSNAQEQVGLNLDETIKICRQIFEGIEVSAENIKPRSEKLEIINHAKALQYITKAIAVDNLPLTEEIVLETHRILTTGIDITPDGTKWQSYAGKYRTVGVHAGNSHFVVSQKVPKVMKDLFEAFNTEVNKIDSTLEVDPVWIATKHCEDFVDIHPFLDGNGRVCRLILNALLLRYAGIIVSIGGHDAEREEYLDVRRRAGDQMEGPGEMSFLVLRRIQKKMSTLRMRCHDAIKKKG